jgi:hypothetical protein
MGITHLEREEEEEETSDSSGTTNSTTNVANVTAFETGEFVVAGSDWTFHSNRTTVPKLSAKRQLIVNKVSVERTLGN